MGKLKNITKKRLFLPIFSMILVILINVVYDIASGNPPFSFSVLPSVQLRAAAVCCSGVSLIS